MNMSSPTAFITSAGLPSCQTARASRISAHALVMRSPRPPAPATKSARPLPPSGGGREGRQNFFPSTPGGPEDKESDQVLGFTRHAEQLNGRIAMMFFMIAILTEKINPNHPTIIEQLKEPLNWIGVLFGAK
mmetsp:Transcript_12997/g.22311  ORF Transcript_12997/g.22311 Transcript_12997/m.22311 type:complete len:132 (+) Transcript_12997:96-491(+)